MEVTYAQGEQPSTCKYNARQGMTQLIRQDPNCRLYDPYQYKTNQGCLSTRHRVVLVGDDTTGHLTTDSTHELLVQDP